MGFTDTITLQVYWLLPPFLIYSLAFGGIVVPRLTLALKLICREYLSDKAAADPNFSFAPIFLGGDNPQCRIPEVQALATTFMLYVSLISGILSAIVSPKLGALSDRYGRKPILCIITAGGIITEVVTILCAKYPDSVHYSWLLAGAFFDGVSGTFIASSAITHSYATDCTAPPKRAIAFGYFHASLFTGIALGPLVAGYITKATGDITIIFFIALVAHLFYLAFIGLVIPESLSKKRQLAAREKHRQEEESAGSGHWLSTLRTANLLAPLKILYPTGEGSSPALRTNLFLLGAVDTLIFGVAMGALNVVLYYSEYQFGWEDFEKNIFVSITSTCRVFVLMIVLPMLNYLVRTRRRNKLRRESGIELLERNSGSDNLDLWTIRSSLVFELLGFIGYSAGRTGSVFIMSGVFASIGGIGPPTLQSALTKHVPHDRTGQLLGAMGLLHALARVVCPTIFSLIYASTVKSLPQVVFMVLAACFFLALVLSMFVKPHGKLPLVCFGR
jgi:MFS family permease